MKNAFQFIFLPFSIFISLLCDVMCVCLSLSSSEPHIALNILITHRDHRKGTCVSHYKLFEHVSFHFSAIFYMKIVQSCIENMKLMVESCSCVLKLELFSALSLSVKWILNFFSSSRARQLNKKNNFFRGKIEEKSEKCFLSKKQHFFRALIWAARGSFSLCSVLVHLPLDGRNDKKAAKNNFFKAFYFCGIAKGFVVHTIFIGFYIFLYNSFFCLFNALHRNKIRIHVYIDVFTFTAG